MGTRPGRPFDNRHGDRVYSSNMTTRSGRCSHPDCVPGCTAVEVCCDAQTHGTAGVWRANGERCAVSLRNPHGRSITACRSRAHGKGWMTLTYSPHDVCGALDLCPGHAARWGTRLLDPEHLTEWRRLHYE